MIKPDLESMTKAELEELEAQLVQERRSRECQEFLPGHQSCDMGSKPHDEHGYTTWHHNGRGKIRITWKAVEGLPKTERQPSEPHVCDNNDDCELHP